MSTQRNIRMIVIAFVLSLPAMVAAHSAIPLCVTVEAEDAAGLRRLVVEEVGHHRTHEVVADHCRRQLKVEYFKTAGLQYLTVRIDQEIPVRFTIEDPRELNRKLTEGISLVLHNDPVYLTEDITHASALQRMGHSILKGGHNTWRVELFQAISRGPNAVFAPGAAFSLSRGSQNWYVLARLYLGGWPGGVSGSDRQLRILAGADAGLTYEVSPLANTSFYVSSGLGIQFMRFEGRLDSGNAKSLDNVNAILFGLQARLGVRFLRWTDFDLDLFVMGHLPFYPSTDSDSLLFGEKGLYTPSLQLGLGVGF